MKILKLGSIPEELKYKAQCDYCGTLVEFLRKEAKYTSCRNESYLIVSCPLCNKSITTEI